MDLDTNWCPVCDKAIHPSLVSQHHTMIEKKYISNTSYVGYRNHSTVLKNAYNTMHCKGIHY